MMDEVTTMSKKIKMVLTLMIIALFTLINVRKSFAAEEEKSEYAEFTDNIQIGYDFYIEEKINAPENNAFNLTIVTGVIDNQISISVYYEVIFQKYSTIFSIVRNEEIRQFNSLNGHSLYNYQFEEGDNIFVRIYVGNPELEGHTYLDYQIYYNEIDKIEKTSYSFGYGYHTFPKNTVFSDENLAEGALQIIATVGIFIIGILIIVIAVLIAGKNVHIRREKPIYYTPRYTNQTENTINQQPYDQETIIDSTATFKETPEEKTEEPLSESEELKRLYTLHARKEITDEELEILLRKYRGKRDDD